MSAESADLPRFAFFWGVQPPLPETESQRSCPSDRGLWRHPQAGGLQPINSPPAPHGRRPGRLSCGVSPARSGGTGQRPPVRPRSTADRSGLRSHVAARSHPRARQRAGPSPSLPPDGPPRAPASRPGRPGSTVHPIHPFRPSPCCPPLRMTANAPLAVTTENGHSGLSVWSSRWRRACLAAQVRHRDDAGRLRRMHEDPGRVSPTTGGWPTPLPAVRATNERGRPGLTGPRSRFPVSRAGGRNRPR